MFCNQCEQTTRSATGIGCSIKGECANPSQNCFCIAAGYSPEADKGFDLAWSELSDGFVVQAGSEKGQAIIDALNLIDAEQSQCDLAQQAIDAGKAKQTRQIPSAAVLQQTPNNDHPAWDKASEQCISCGSCTQVCPTCFCSRNMDLPAMDGEGYEQVRMWDSCFSDEHGYTHGHSYRQGTKAHYQQWLNHKFSWWQNQFDTSGCVGCGRCLSWCPQKIDHTDILSQLHE